MWALKNLAEVATVVLLQYPLEALALVLYLRSPNLGYYKLYLGWSCLLSQFLKGSYFLETGQAIE